MPVFVDHRCLRAGEQRRRFIGKRSRQRGIADLVIGVILEGDRRARRIQLERALADASHGRIETKQRPVAAGDRQVLLLHAETHVDAVSDALAIGEDQRGTVIGLRLPKRIQRLLRIGAHRDLGHIDVAIGDGLQGEILARDPLPGRREFCDRAKRGRLRGLTAGVGIDLGVEDQDIDVTPGRHDVIEAAKADVIGPAVAADDPDAPPHEMVHHGKQIARRLAIDL